MRLKDYGFMYSGLTGKSGDDFRCEDLSQTKAFIPFTNILNNFAIDHNQFKQVVMADGEQQNRVLGGDLLFLMSSEDYESIGKSAVVLGNPGEVYLNSFCRGYRFRHPRTVNSKYVNYQLACDKCRDNLRFEARGFTRINLKIDRVESVEINLPPLSEQDRIVAYLDEKTAAIDTQVSLLEQKAKKYEQLKKSLISRTVTRSLNKDVRLKDSGIDWIGQIPAHWEVKRGKDLLKITNGFPADSNLFDTDGVGIPLIRIRDINSSSTEVTYAGTDYTKDFLINRGDLLVGMDGDFNSANWKGDTALLNQRVCKIESRKLESRYLSYIITFPLLEINAQKVLTTVKHLASSDLYEISLPLPPLSEQQAIADYLDKKTAEIDAAIANINQQIEKYKLLRRALINEVVTGQRAI